MLIHRRQKVCWWAKLIQLFQGMIWVGEKQFMPCWKRSLFSVFVEKRGVNYLKTGQWTLLSVVLKTSYGVVTHSPVVTHAIASGPKGICHVLLAGYVSLWQHWHLFKCSSQTLYVSPLWSAQKKKIASCEITFCHKDTQIHKGQRLNVALKSVLGLLLN